MIFPLIKCKRLFLIKCVNVALNCVKWENDFLNGISIHLFIEEKKQISFIVANNCVESNTPHSKYVHIKSNLFSQFVTVLRLSIPRKKLCNRSQNLCKYREYIRMPAIKEHFHRTKFCVFQNQENLTVFL